MGKVWLTTNLLLCGSLSHKLNPRAESTTCMCLYLELPEISQVVLILLSASWERNPGFCLCVHTVLVHVPVGNW